MKFLYIFTDLDIGGIETLILRSARWLNRNGHEVDLILSRGGELLSEVSKFARVNVIGKFRYHTFSLPYLRNIYREGYDVIHAFSYDSTWLGAQISRDTGSKLMVGVYHPQAFGFYEGYPPYFIRKYFQLFDSLPEENILFMNNPTKKEHEKYYKKEFTKSRILPLPIDNINDNNHFDRNPISKPYKLISVGRLVDFKVYHFGVIDVVKRMVGENIDIEYYIYGDGRLRNELRQYIESQELTSNVFLMGEVEYCNFHKVLKDGYVFLGMGTSLVEAAMMGIPSLAMPIWEKSGLTYGLFNSLEDYSLGEQGKSKSVYDEIKNLIIMDKNDYLRVCEIEKQAAAKYSTDYVMGLYISYCHELIKISYIPSISESLGVISSRLLNTKIPYYKNRLVHRDLRYKL